MLLPETNVGLGTEETGLAYVPAASGHTLCATPGTEFRKDTARHWLFLGSLILGYIGVYLCRKNLSVAVPMIQKAFGVNKAQTGAIASTATLAYMCGKIFFGPVIDRIGGRTSFFMALAGVILFGALGSLSGSIAMLTIFYTGNRFFGAAGWGAMVKQVPDWFSTKRLPLALALLSMSYAVGGYFALFLAGWIATASGENWRMVLGVPSLVVAVILLICWLVLPRSKPAEFVGQMETSPATQNPLQRIAGLARYPQFWVTCGLSFVLTIVRDFFNDWSVDFFKSAGGAATSTQLAAQLSTSFDLAGAFGILFLGAVLQRISLKGRKVLLMLMLLCLGVLIYALPALASYPLWIASVVIGAIGFLSYGPYSLLAGVFAVEIKGREHVATVAGFVDASGYLAGVLAGYPFGLILDHGGYRAGFHTLAWISLFAVALCLLLRHTPKGVMSNSSMAGT